MRSPDGIVPKFFLVGLIFLLWGGSYQVSHASSQILSQEIISPPATEYVPVSWDGISRFLQEGSGITSLNISGLSQSKPRLEQVAGAKIIRQVLPKRGGTEIFDFLALFGLGIYGYLVRKAES